jgi:hypothetical protein
VLQEKIRLLREAAKYNPTAGHGEEADRLEGKGPGSGKVDESFFQRILQQNPNDVNANLALEAITKQKIAALDAQMKSVEKAATAVDKIQPVIPKAPVPPPTAPERGDTGFSSAARQSGADAAGGLDQFGSSIGTGLEQLRAAIDNALNDLPQQFGPVADAIQNEIPAAVEKGTEALSQAVVSSVGNMAAQFNKKADDLQKQIDALWQAV